MINNQFMSTNMPVKKVTDGNGNPAYINRGDKLDADDVLICKEQVVGSKTISKGTNIIDVLKEVTVTSNQTDLINAIYDLQSRLAIAESKIEGLKKTNISPLAVTAGSTITANDATKDYVISGDITKASTMTAKSVTLDNINMSGDVKNTTITVSDELTVKDSNFNMNTTTSSNVIKVIDGEYLTIKDTTFTGTTYNTIMSGQTCTKYLKGCSIENCNFDEICKHVNIWFAGFQDNAVLNISNCHFKSAEQFLCISDYSGTDKHLTINISNCVIDEYEKDGSEYEGIILFDDRFCTDETSFLSAKPFANITVNINNLTVGGVKMNSDNFIIANGGSGQMVYMYCAKSRKTYKFAEHPELFPKFNVA